MDPNTTIGAIVAEDYRTAKVFEEHGIDFCCGGTIALSAACLAKGLDLATILGQLDGVKKEPVARNQDYAAWQLPFLIDYIINVHHTYLQENTGQITEYTRKIAAVHGARHPELPQISATFTKIAEDLTAHLREEEDTFFPAIKRLVAQKDSGGKATADDIATVHNSLKKLLREHEEVGEAIHTIRALAKGYAIPGDACNTFTVTYQKLQEFEDDLHKHVHLENNIVFLKAAQL